jgi:hypothetical protein
MRLILLAIAGLILAGCVVEPMHPELRMRPDSGYHRY